MGKTRKFILLVIAIVATSSQFYSLAYALNSENRICLNPKERIVDTSPFQGQDFPRWRDLTLAQQFFMHSFAGAAPSDTEYTDMTIKQNGRTTNFLALTHALSLVSLEIPNKVVTALDLILDVREIRSDRVFVILDQDLVKEWQAAGGGYSIALSNGKKEESHVNFYRHNTHDAGLHCGFDLQWYTRPNKTPHLHWNMRFSDGYADVHLDGYRGWFFEVIPNFRHLTYANSDVRYWFNKYEKKYGVPGFDLRKK